MEFVAIVAAFVGFVMGFVFRPFIAAQFGWKQ